VAGRTATYNYKLQSLFKDSLEPRPSPQTRSYKAHISQHTQRRRSGIGWAALAVARVWHRTTTASTGQLYYEGDAHPLNYHMTGSYSHVIITHRSFYSYSACSSCRSSLRNFFLALNQIRLGSPNLLPPDEQDPAP